MGTTHCWMPQLDGYSKVDMRGNHVSYRFSADVTDDSERRLFAFLRSRDGEGFAVKLTRER